MEEKKKIDLTAELERDDLFEDEHRPWIGPGAVPPSPIIPTQPSGTQTSPKAPATSVPPGQPASTPTAVPPSPITPPPPLPDPRVTRINALRALATENDDSPTDRVSTANYTVPATDKRRVVKQARQTQPADKE